MRIPHLGLWPMLAVALVGTAAPAQGQDEDSRWYLELGTGMTFPLLAENAPADTEIEFDEGLGLSLLVGYHLNRPSRERRVSYSLQLEGFYTESDVDEADFITAGASNPLELSTSALLVNAVADWRWSDQVSLYGGLGVGYASKVDLENGSELLNEFGPGDDGGLAWQGKAGLRYRLGSDSNFSWSLGWRYFQTQDIELEDGGGASFDLENAMHAVEIGVRWGI